MEKANVSFTIEAKAYAAMKRKAKREGVSMAKFIRTSISVALKRIKAAK